MCAVMEDKIANEKRLGEDLQNKLHRADDECMKKELDI